MVRCDYREDDASVAGLYRIGAFGPSLLRGLRAGRTVVLPDTQRASDLEESERTALVAAGVRAYVVVPLIKDGRLVATFAADQSQPRRWTAAEVVLVEETAERTWAAVERARAEETLRDSEERFRTLVIVITDVPWTTDAEGRFATPQPAWTAYTGQTWEQLRGFGWLDAVHPDDRARVRTLWDQARAARSLYQSDGRLWHAPARIPVLRRPSHPRC